MILTHGIYAYSSHTERIQKLPNVCYKSLNYIILYDYRMGLHFKDTLREYIRKHSIRSNVCRFRNINLPYYTLRMMSNHSYCLTTLRRCIN